ncbi:hypothetical protein SLEP1_g31339 [Rubroshorea leprosula]|uniref:Uncharacterized protein n=1 Tax=Rubroshorea leprosula TaxID=152421 RepID=A0AAV5K335_9ROSI|nr:hypothetical protein SLEP1_g31339 [Rubroshorea leprosula]
MASGLFQLNLVSVISVENHHIGAAPIDHCVRILQRTEISQGVSHLFAFVFLPI